MARHTAFEHGLHQLAQPYEKVVIHALRLLKRAARYALHGQVQAVFVKGKQLGNAVNALQAFQREALAPKAAPPPVADNKCLDNLEIGRASCRETVKISVGEGAVKRKNEYIDGRHK